MSIRNTLIIFIVSGFWHGANWTFIAWGALHGLLFLPLLLAKKNRKYRNTVAEGHSLPNIKELGQMIMTFGIVVLGWIFFRADSIGHAMSYISGILSPSLLAIPKFPGMLKALTTIILVIVFVIIEWTGREQQYAIAHAGFKWKRPFRFAMYYCIIFLIMYFGNFNENQFIYFQF